MNINQICKMGRICKIKFSYKKSIHGGLYKMANIFADDIFKYMSLKEQKNQCQYVSRYQVIMACCLFL